MTHHKDYKHTDEANEARFLKATELVGALQSAGYTLTRARALSEEQRRVVERFAHVAKCSPETWSMALDILKGATHKQRVGASS